MSGPSDREVAVGIQHDDDRRRSLTSRVRRVPAAGWVGVALVAWRYPSLRE